MSWCESKSGSHFERGVWNAKRGTKQAGVRLNFISHSAFRIPHFWKAGRYELAAPVSKTGSAQTRGRSITDAFLHFGRVPTLNRNPQRKETYATCYPLPKPVALSQELQTKSRHPNPTGHEAELHFSSDATVWFKAAIGTRLVAQEQSARLISGRPRSVSARDDQPSPAGYWLAGHFPRVAEAD